MDKSFFASKGGELGGRRASSNKLFSNKASRMTANTEEKVLEEFNIVDGPSLLDMFRSFTRADNSSNQSDLDRLTAAVFKVELPENASLIIETLRLEEMNLGVRVAIDELKRPDKRKPDEKDIWKFCGEITGYPLFRLCHIVYNPKTRKGKMTVEGKKR